MSAETSKKKQQLMQVQDNNKAVVAQVREEQYSGIIPHPDIIKGYEDILPGACDRILSMTEKQTESRIQMEKYALEKAARDSLLGIICAFTIGAGGIVAAVMIAINVPGNAGVICGSLLGVTGIGSIVATFLNNTRMKQSNDREE